MRKVFIRNWYKIVKNVDVEIAFPCVYETGIDCVCNIVCRGPHYEPYQNLPKLLNKPHKLPPRFQKVCNTKSS